MSGDNTAIMTLAGIVRALIVRLKLYVRIFSLFSQLRRAFLSGLSQTRHAFAP